MDGLERGAGYSLPPCSLGLCGQKGSADVLFGYIDKKKSKEEVKKEFRKFEGLYPYLELIASESSMKPFDSKVIDAYWIGNELLENVRISKFRKMIMDKFSGKGKLPLAVAKRFASLLPEGAIPHHSFHVLYFNSITGRLSPSIRLLDKCRIGWGKVERVGKKNAIVSSSPLLFRKGLYFLGRARKEEVSLMYRGRQLVNPKKGDIVTFHWGIVVDILTEEQRDNLRAYTLRSIKGVNRIGKRTVLGSPRRFTASL